MGKKLFAVIGTLNVISVGLCVLGLNLPIHKLSFFIAKFVRAFRIKTYMLSAALEEDSSDFCYVFNQIKPGFCTSVSGSRELQDMAQRFCVDVMYAVMPNACTGLTNAYHIGLAITIGGCMDILFLIVAMYLLWYYIYQSQKRMYWTIALVIFCSSSIIGMGLLASYYAFVILYLDNLEVVGALPVTTFVISSSKQGGVYYGFWCYAVAMFFQLVIVSLMPLSRSSRELDDEELLERKEAKKAAKDLERSGEWQQGGMQQGGMQPLQPQPFVVSGYGAAGYGPGPVVQRVEVVEAPGYFQPVQVVQEPAFMQQRVEVVQEPAFIQQRVEVVQEPAFLQPSFGNAPPIPAAPESAPSFRGA